MSPKNNVDWKTGFIFNSETPWYHYGDVIMGVMTSQITSLTIVYSTACSGVDQIKHQSSCDRWIPRTKGQ